MTVSRRTFLASGATLLAGQGCRNVAQKVAATIGASPIDCTLLRASGLAYGIDLTGKYTPDPPYAPALQYLSEPVTVSSRDITKVGELNACLVGKNTDGILVAFRGTVYNSVLDWLEDLLIKPERRPPLPGAVHTGFHVAVKSIIRGVIAAVQNLDPKSNAVYVTGHSKGGGMAPIAAYLLRQANPDIRIAQVITFAAPRPGDAEFRDAYEKVVGNHVRYENYGDLVPLVPAADRYLANRVSDLANIPVIGAKLKPLQDLANLAAEWNYQPVGVGSYIDSLHKIVQNVNHNSQVDDLIRNLAQHPTDALVNAHGLQNGYMLGVCPAAVASTT